MKIAIIFRAISGFNANTNTPAVGLSRRCSGNTLCPSWSRNNCTAKRVSWRSIFDLCTNNPAGLLIATRNSSRYKTGKSESSSKFGSISVVFKMALLYSRVDVIAPINRLCLPNAMLRLKLIPFPGGTQVPKLLLGNPVVEAPASRDGKLELPVPNSQAGAWELANRATKTTSTPPPGWNNCPTPAHS